MREYLRKLLGETVGRILDELVGRSVKVTLFGFTPSGPNFTDDRGKLTIHIKTPRALRALIVNPSSLALGEAYIFGELEIEGNLGEALALTQFLEKRNRSLKAGLKIRSFLIWIFSYVFRVDREDCIKIIRSKALTDHDSIAYHYDELPEFFQLFLDKRMTYSCALTRQGESLDKAQVRKLTLVCHKLGLQPDDKVLDMGSGWGSFAIFAAETYKCHVTGITLSQSQINYSQRLSREVGLDMFCRFKFGNFLEEQFGEFDKIVSIGAIEHVRPERLPDFFRAAWKQLIPGKVFLVQSITCNPSIKIRPGPSFRDKYVFPNSKVIELNRIVASAENVGFEVLDIQSFRHHYAKTLSMWSDRLANHWPEAVKLVGETKARVFKLWQAAFAYEFNRGALNVYQILFGKPFNGEVQNINRRLWDAP